MQTGERNQADAIRRTSVDLTDFPDLVVIYLGFRASTWRGLLALFGIGRELRKLAREKPDGLLVHEFLLYAPNHIGMRQYWRDFESLEAFTKSDPHRTWWRRFSRVPGGAGFWHEAYRRNGGMEAIYVGLPVPIGLGAFAAPRVPLGPFASSRQRLAT